MRHPRYGGAEAERIIRIEERFTTGSRPGPQGPYSSIVDVPSLQEAAGLSPRRNTNLRGHPYFLNFQNSSTPAMEMREKDRMIQNA